MHRVQQMHVVSCLEDLMLGVVVAGGPDHQWHQRRGDARAVGVPDRPRGPGGGRRPGHGRPLAAAPPRRELRHRVHLRPQARQG